MKDTAKGRGAQPQAPEGPASSPDAAFKDYMRRQIGVAPEGPIRWDRKVHRFPGKGKEAKGRKNDAGWYVGFLDRSGGQFGDHSQGISRPGLNWQHKREKPPTAEERAEWARQERERQKRIIAAEKRAAEEVREAWDAAAPAKKAHPYLTAKRITQGFGKRVRILKAGTPGLRMMGEPLTVRADWLLVKMLHAGALVNVQRIALDGRKRFWPRARVVETYCPFGILQDGAPIYLCEGPATAWSIARSTGNGRAIAAFSTSGLLPVGKLLAAKYGGKRIIVAADNDRWSKLQDETPNPGVHYATEAASIIGARVAIPDFVNLDGEPTDFNDLHVRENVRAVRRWLNPDLAERAHIVPAGVPDPREEPEEPAPEGEDGEKAPPPERYEFGKLVVTRDVDGLVHALRHCGFRIRLNLRGYREEYRTEPDGWNDISKYLIADLRLTQIPGKCVFAIVTKEGEKIVDARWGRDAFRDTLQAGMWEARCDPFLQYLEGLPDWDGTPRIDHWLADVFDCDDSELARWAARYYFMGAVTRTLRPGAKLDETPVLIGEKATGKSTAVRRWLHDEEYFGDCVNFKQTAKEQAEGMQGKVVVEIAEMAGSTRAEIDALKAFLVRQREQVRLAYGYQVERQPRRCIFFGTANPGTPIPDDDAASRRFVVIPVGPTEEGVSGLRDYQDENREQCWAEALHRVRQGEPARLPEHLFEQQAAANDEFRNRDLIFEEAVEAALSKVSSIHPSGVRLIDLKREMEGQASGITVRSSKKIAFTLRRMGWEPVDVRYTEGGRSRTRKAWVQTGR